MCVWFEDKSKFKKSFLELLEDFGEKKVEK